jgi:hypothetical protein
LGFLVAISLSAHAAGPVDFGMSELDAAIAARNFKYKPRIVTEIDLEAPETFRIEPYTAGGGRIAGGDLRGLMYGLLEAAEQIRATGRLKQAHGTPSLAPRGVKVAADPASTWFGSEAFWAGFMASLARDRFDRLQLVFERLPDKDLLPVLRMISRTALQYSIDVALGLRSALEDSGPLLQDLLAQCPAIRSISLASDADGTKTTVMAVLRKAGRRVVLDDNRLWQIDPVQNGHGEESVRMMLATLTAGFEVVLPQSGDGKPDWRLIGLWGRLAYKR